MAVETTKTIEVLRLHCFSKGENSLKSTYGEKKEEAATTLNVIWAFAALCIQILCAVY